MKNAKYLGFTLIELLVVIGIIGILAALILVALGAARSKSQDARVISNVKQMRGLAELYYDSNGASYDKFYRCVRAIDSASNSYCLGGIGQAVQNLKDDTAEVNDGWSSGRGAYMQHHKFPIHLI